MKKLHGWHPLLFAAFPVLSLYGLNFHKVAFREAAPFLVLSLGATLGLWLVLSLALRNRFRGGLLVSLALALFFSYGHAYRMLEGAGFRVGNLVVGENKILLVLWAVLLGLGVFLVLKKRGDFPRLTRFLDLVSAVLVLLPLLTIGRGLLDSSGGAARAAGGEPVPALREGGARPDIYYLILDGYGSSEVLREFYGFDNREFLDYLKSRGFYVAEQSRSNYSSTTFSLPSALNMEYINPVAERMGPDAQDVSPMVEMTQDHQVAAFLKVQGYRYVHVSSAGFWMSKRNRNADWNLECRRGGEFQTNLVMSSLLRIFSDRYGAIDRERVLNAFAAIPRIRENIEGPRFVFAHFLIPHPPYIFAADGGKILQTGMPEFFELRGWQMKDRYLDQIRFTNSKVKELLESLLADPDYSPVVVIQADHGPASTDEWKNPSERMLRERLGILNAYFVPGPIRDRLYPSITPVNSFRLILGGLFGADLPLLEDRSYFSSYDRLYDLADVTDLLTADEEDSDYDYDNDNDSEQNL